MKKRAAPLFLAVLTACALACPALAAEVKHVLEFNKAERHIRGGEATRNHPLRTLPSRGFGVHGGGPGRAQDQQDLRTLSYG